MKIRDSSRPDKKHNLPNSQQNDNKIGSDKHVKPCNDDMMNTKSTKATMIDDDDNHTRRLIIDCEKELVVEGKIINSDLVKSNHQNNTAIATEPSLEEREDSCPSIAEDKTEILDLNSKETKLFIKLLSEQIGPHDKDARVLVVESMDPFMKTSSEKLGVKSIDFFQCRKCSFSSTYQKEFDQHELVCLKDDVLFICDQCDFRTNVETYWNKHINDHKMIHICKFCSKKFVEKESLKKHLLTHAGNFYSAVVP